MRLEIPHSLGKDEVRRRITARMGSAEDKAGALIGGPLSLHLAWIDRDNLSVEATAMGTETALVFDVTIPGGLGFARGMIEGLIRERGEKLLA